MLECVDVMKIYFDPVTEYRVPALRGINMTINEGELVSIIGPSGAGKTTLTNLLSGNDTPSGGMITVNDQRLDTMTNKERRQFRFENIGMVNQFIGRNSIEYNPILAGFFLLRDYRRTIFFRFGFNFQFF